MNLAEKQMVGRLIELKEKYGVIGVKLEFETEGTRVGEAMRLKDISLSAGLGFTVKVGGCEALTDMFYAVQLGTDNLVAPMVETAYALKKYLGALRIVFPKDSREDVDFLINLETVTACNNFPEMLELSEIGELDGIVLGRGDLTGSMNLTRDQINRPEVLEICLKMAKLAKTKDLKVIVGGGVSADSLPFFRAFPPGHLDRYETRKVVFGCPAALANPAEAFLKAVEFEVMWLKNKKSYYTVIYSEDDPRLQLMEQRYGKAIDEMNRKQRR